MTDLGEVELRIIEGGVAIPASVLSEGTLRMLGLLALASAEAPALVGFEEPENGVHPRRIELIAELLRTQRSLGQTQYIVTTHSPRLPDLLADDSLFVVRRRNGQTRIDPLAGEPMEHGKPSPTRTKPRPPLSGSSEGTSIRPPAAAIQLRRRRRGGSRTSPLPRASPSLPCGREALPKSAAGAG